MRKQKNAIRRASFVIKENRLILFGALVMLAWTLWEGAVRYEAVDGVTKAISRSGARSKTCGTRPRRAATF